MHLPRAISSAVTACLISSNVPIKNGTETPFNLRVAYTPVAVAVPSTVQHIEKAVECAVRHNVNVTPRSGGHSYTSSGLGGENGHLVVEMANFNKVKVGCKGTAFVGTGARLGQVAQELWNKGRALAHGSCPGVGVGGHVLHGGWSTSSHLKGLSIDYIVGATVTLANATTVNVSATAYPDIFWAIRGAGSSFGIVSQVKFNTFPAPQVMTPFVVEWDWITRQNGSTDAAVEGLNGLQNWALNGTMPPELWMNVGISEGSAKSDGLFWGTQEQLKAAAESTFANIGGTLNASDQVNWIDQVKYFAGGPLEGPSVVNANDTFYATSLTTHALTTQQLQNFTKQWFATKSPDPNRSWWIQFDLHGGNSSAISKIAVDATPYPHRDKLLLFQFYDSVTYPNKFPADGTNLLQGLVKSITSSMDDDAWGLYANYPDQLLSQEEAQKRYWGSNLPRLKQIKKAADPNDLFHYPQGVSAA